MLINPPTESVRLWHPVYSDALAAYGNKPRPTYDMEHSEVIEGVVVGDVTWSTESDEEQPYAITESVALYFPKGCDGPFEWHRVTVRGNDYLVGESHIYDERGVPGPHNAWVKAERRIGQ